MVFFASDIKHVDPSSAAHVTDGRYSLKGIRPGKYRLFAVDLLAMMPAIDGTGNNDETMQQLLQVDNQEQRLQH